jgi:hypothetical protein
VAITLSTINISKKKGAARCPLGLSYWRTV